MLHFNLRFHNKTKCDFTHTPTHGHTTISLHSTTATHTHTKQKGNSISFRLVFLFASLLHKAFNFRQTQNPQNLLLRQNKKRDLLCILLSLCIDTWTQQHLPSLPPPPPPSSSLSPPPPHYFISTQRPQTYTRTREHGTGHTESQRQWNCAKLSLALPVFHTKYCEFFAEHDMCVWVCVWYNRIWRFVNDDVLWMNRTNGWMGKSSSFTLPLKYIVQVHSVASMRSKVTSVILANWNPAFNNKCLSIIFHLPHVSRMERINILLFVQIWQKWDDDTDATAHRNEGNGPTSQFDCAIEPTSVTTLHFEYVAAGCRYRINASTSTFITRNTTTIHDTLPWLRAVGLGNWILSSLFPNCYRHAHSTREKPTHTISNTESFEFQHIFFIDSGTCSTEIVPSTEGIGIVYKNPNLANNVRSRRCHYCCVSV